MYNIHLHCSVLEVQCYIASLSTCTPAAIALVCLPSPTGVCELSLESHDSAHIIAVAFDDGYLPMLARLTRLHGLVSAFSADSQVRSAVAV
jgi:hypothetical protein